MVKSYTIIDRSEMTWIGKPARPPP